MEAFAFYPEAPDCPIRPCQERPKYKIPIGRCSWLTHTSTQILISSWKLIGANVFFQLQTDIGNNLKRTVKRTRNM